MIHLYAFVTGLRTLPAVAGVAGEALEVHHFDGADAVVGTLDAPATESVENAVAHGVVAESLLDCADAVLPARFGKPFADATALVEATISRLPELRARLAGVCGCVELTVRIAAPATATPAPVGGAAYLHELAATTVARDWCIAETHDALDTRALDSRVEPLTHGTSLFRGAYLVRRPEVDAFAQAVDRLAGRFPDMSILCTGPWAPSSFAQEAA